MPKHKVFVSYHHKNDQWYKDELIRMGKEYAVFIDKSVGGGNLAHAWRFWPDPTMLRSVLVIGAFLRHSVVILAQLAQ